MFSQNRHRSLSILSNRTNSTWRSDLYGHRQPRGAMVFTGPDGLRMHRQKVIEPLYTGEIGVCSPERSSAVLHIMRAAPGTPHPRPKTAFSDAYGWGAWGEMAKLCSWHNTSSHHPIKLQTFRQLLEQRATHSDQSAWYSGRDVQHSSRQLRRHGMASPEPEAENGGS